MQGAGFRVPDAEFRVQGSAFSVQCSGLRTQGTEFGEEGVNPTECILEYVSRQRKLRHTCFTIM